MVAQRKSEPRQLPSWAIRVIDSVFLPPLLRVERRLLRSMARRRRKLSDRLTARLAVDKAVLQRRALNEARALHRLLKHDEGPDARLVLGRFHLARHQALPEDRRDAERRAAMLALKPLFLAGVSDIPEAWLPDLADAAYADAFRRSRAIRDGAVADAEDVALWRRIVRHTPPSHPDRARRLFFHAHVLHARYAATGDPEFLDAALAGAEAARSVLPSEAEERERGGADLLLTALSLEKGRALLDRFASGDSREDLTRAITCLEAARSSPEEAIRLSAAVLLAGARAQRATLTRDRAELEAAIGLSRATLGCLPHDHPDRALLLANLGGLLRERFEFLGARADLDEAVESLETARAAVMAGDHAEEDLSLILGTLGATLFTRFYQQGESKDLDAAIACFEAAKVRRSHHAMVSLVWTNYGIALWLRHERAGVRADLAKAITHLSASREVLPSEDPGRALASVWLGAALVARFQSQGRLSDVEQAIALLQEAVRGIPGHGAERCVALAGLGEARLERFKATGDRGDLDDAVRWHREAAAALPEDHPEAAVLLFNLGVAHRARHEVTGGPADLDAAIAAFAASASSPHASRTRRIFSARAAYELLAPIDPTRAADIAEAAVRLLPEVTPRRLSRGDQQHALATFSGLAADAASLALSSPDGTAGERAVRALRLLESGRAVLHGQSMDTRSDLTDLRARHPDLAARFVAARDHLDQSQHGGPLQASAGTGPTRARHRLADELTTVLEEIRTRDGFATFGLPPETEELLAEAAHGPIVVLNVSRYRGDALLLTARGVSAVPLPLLRLDRVNEHVAAFRTAVNAHTASGRRQKARREAAQTAAARILEWLWDAVAEPVLDELGLGAPAPPTGVPPRVWWVPVGPLAALPLHAAGHHASDPAAGRSVMDRVVSSYSPTVRALRYARERDRRPLPADEEEHRAVIVAMPTTPGQQALPHAGVEAETVRRHLPAAVVLHSPTADVRDGAEPTRSLPTRDNVLRQLRACRIAHFACHAVNDVDPSASRLLLHEDAAPLTVEDLSSTGLDDAQLAYLSACHSAIAENSALSDESIHLTSAFQLAGFPHVIGTLWEITDELPVRAAENCYLAMRTGDGRVEPSRAAAALHQAVRRLRDGHDLPRGWDRRSTPLLWAAYLHSGA
ncbi:CHAT domain-containing protein [Streptomyces mayteni]